MRIDIKQFERRPRRCWQLARRGPLTLTVRGRAAFVLTPVATARPEPRRRSFLGALAGRGAVPDDFDAPLPEDELAAWEP
ncbi:hypothetical protein CCR85_06895 [Rhodothalassium salexigens]|uniref:hypothetical protein n=1 Tax=Rhodothalassium salexigens TaxID=1086 RepID=UPI0019128E9F|nr:hypothetical protein [Rhodothalassium salexigens]MBK5911219.1 hypothetical protein [Rhodothalassium salexigens]MBK5919908.1 hypothetical protein [Rhodothalassium salexigens]